MEAEDSQKHAERVAKLMSRVVEDPEYDTHSPEVLKAAGARYGVKTHIGMHIVSKRTAVKRNVVPLRLWILDRVQRVLEDPEPRPGQQVLPGLTLEDWSHIQLEDATLRRVI